MRAMEDEQPELYECAQLVYYADFVEGKLWNDLFQEMSTGHKYFFRSMLYIIAYCEENAMLLFDEPENYLQSPRCLL